MKTLVIAILLVIGITTIAFAESWTIYGGGETVTITDRGAEMVNM